MNYKIRKISWNLKNKSESKAELRKVNINPSDRLGRNLGWPIPSPFPLPKLHASLPRHPRHAPAAPCCPAPMPPTVPSVSIVGAIVLASWLPVLITIPTTAPSRGHHPSPDHDVPTPWPSSHHYSHAAIPSTQHDQPGLTPRSLTNTRELLCSHIIYAPQLPQCLLHSSSPPSFSSVRTNGNGIISPCSRPPCSPRPSRCTVG